MPRLADEDLVAEKLLANADRYLDDAALARDAIDLIVLEHTLADFLRRRSRKQEWRMARR